MKPPAIYARWWLATERCSGLTGDFRSIRWYRIAGFHKRGQPESIDGVYSPWGQYIVIVDPDVDAGQVVRHEMLHALLHAAGHPRDQFLGNCKDVVACGGSCVTDAGPWHPSSPFVYLPVDSLAISSTVELLPPETDGQRWVVLTVTATNPLSQAVFAVSRNGNWLAWGVNNGFLSGSDVVGDAENIYFDAHQTRSWTYEMRVTDVTGIFTISPGPHDIAGGFGDHWTPFTHLVVMR